MSSFTINIGSWIERNAERFRHKVAVRSVGRELTFGQLADRVRRLASGLRAAGLKRGDRVALLLFNGIEAVEGVFAAAAAGFIAVPLNWRLSEEELAGIARDCTPSALVYDAALAGRADAIAGAMGEQMLPIGVNTSAGGREYEELLASAEPLPAVDPEVGGEDVHVLLYTSGTTGRPKGVMLTHANTFWQSVNAWALGTSPEGLVLVVLPMFHAGGLNGSVTPVLHVGATVILPRTFDAGEVLAMVERDRISGMVAVPTVYQMLAEHEAFERTDLSSIVALISGGARLPEELIRLYDRRGIELRQGYGLTETAPGATGMGPGEHLRKAGTVGKPCTYVDVRIEDESGRELPVGQTGEVCIRGPNVMKGYWNMPEETAEALRGGWFHSGDLGFLDEDGFLTLVGRKKDMIISGGENIFPAEIEHVLGTHPEILEAAVVGVPDDRWGEVPVAFVAPRPGRALDAEELATFCSGKLARYKVPKRFVVLEALPKAALDKVNKAALVAMLSSGDA